MAGSGSESGEARTDPMLPRITDDLLRSADRPPSVPTLDDRTLAALLAELDGHDYLPPPDELPPAIPATPAPRESPDRLGGRSPASDTDRFRNRAAPRPRPAADPSVAPPDREPGPAGDRTGRTPDPGPPDRASDPVRPDRAPGPVRPVRAPGPGDAPSSPRDDAAQPRLCESGIGPVLRTPYGDFRPPVGRTPEASERPEPPEPHSLTGLGLTRRTWSRRGSRLFTVVFVAIFLLIVIQTVVSVLAGR